jgi:hypothetical protein
MNNTNYDIINVVISIYGNDSPQNILKAMDTFILDSISSKILYNHLKNTHSDSINFNKTLATANAILNKRGLSISHSNYFTPCPAPQPDGCLHPSPSPEPSPLPAQFNIPTPPTLKRSCCCENKRCHCLFEPPFINPTHLFQNYTTNNTPISNTNIINDNNSQAFNIM